MIEQHDIQETLDELREELGLGGTFDSHQFIEKYRATHEQAYIDLLNEKSKADANNNVFQSVNSQIAKFLSNNKKVLMITKDERANTRNDHGNNTGNQVWRFLSMILIVIASLMPQHIFAQDNAKDMSIIFTKELFFADSTYIDNRINLLNEIEKQIDLKKKSFESKEAENFYNRLYAFRVEDFRSTGHVPIPILGAAVSYKKIDKKALNRQMHSDIEYMRNSLSRLLGKELEKENLSDTGEGYVCLFNRLETNTDFRTTEVYFDPIPVNRYLVEADCTTDEFNAFKKQSARKDDREMIKGYEWCYDISNMKRKIIHFPQEVTYSVHPNHPEYAVKGDILYDMEGNLKVILNDLWGDTGYEGDGIMGDTWWSSEDFERWVGTLKNIIYTHDFNANKYNVKSEDELTKKYIEMTLNGQLDSLRNETMGKMLAKIIVGAAASEMTSDPLKQLEIADKVRQGTITDAVEFMNSIDKEKMKRAQQYIDQLKADHKGEFDFGRKKRINATSYQFSLVDTNGKMTYIVKVEYIQDGPFNTKKNVTTTVLGKMVTL